MELFGKDASQLEALAEDIERQLREADFIINRKDWFDLAATKDALITKQAAELCLKKLERTIQYAKRVQQAAYVARLERDVAKREDECAGIARHVSSLAEELNGVRIPATV